MPVSRPFQSLFDFTEACGLPRVPPATNFTDTSDPSVSFVQHTDATQQSNSFVRLLIFCLPQALKYCLKMQDGPLCELLTRAVKLVTPLAGRCMSWEVSPVKYVFNVA